MLFKINIIDDEKNLNDLVRTYLEKEGYSVCSFYTYDEALLHKDDDVHLWLIDIMLDKASGFELFNEIKASKPKMPIIFMSARDQEFDRIIGLEKGSDDYITKPFNPIELKARVKSQLRRYKVLGAAPMEKDVLSVGDIVLNDAAKEVTLMDEKVSLTPKEYGILKLLMEHRGRVFSLSEIYSRVWNEEAFGAEGTVAVHIRHLREKLEINPDQPRHLKVVWGQGYKIE